MKLHPAEATPSLVGNSPAIVQSQVAPDTRLHAPCDPHFESFEGSLEDGTTKEVQDIEAGSTTGAAAAGTDPRCHMTRPAWLAKLDLPMLIRSEGVGLRLQNRRERGKNKKTKNKHAFCFRYVV